MQVERLRGADANPDNLIRVMPAEGSGRLALTPFFGKSRRSVIRNGGSFY